MAIHSLLSPTAVLAVLLPLAAPLFAQDKLANPPVPRDTHGVDMRTQAGPPGPDRYSPPFPLNPRLPTLWLIGDSTVRNGSKGDGTNLNQWGWGAPITFCFDPARINVVNRALGGTSARSFYRANWPRVAGLIRPGDFVVMQFGTNDGRHPLGAVGDLPGIGDQTEQAVGREGKAETVHTYGWYLRRMIEEARSRGATPIVCSLIPRKRWDASGHIQRDRDGYAGWAAEIARQEHTGFVDLNERSAAELDRLGKAETNRLYVPNPGPGNPQGEHVHTGWDGAVLNARAVVAGLRALPGDPLGPYFRGGP